MDSRRRKKKKQLSLLNKKLNAEKCYIKLPNGKKFLRFLKETGMFMQFVRGIMIKHNLNFKSAINLVKSHQFAHIEQTIYSLVGYLFLKDIYEFSDKFRAFRPPC